jgi:5'-nucleotidase
MPLVRSLLGLNRFQGAGDKNPLVEVVVMSRNSPETGVRVFNNIRDRRLLISRHAFTGGESVVDYLDAFDVDLFLTTNVRDAQRVIDGKVCAAAIVKKPPEDKSPLPEDQVRIAFDGDAVLFDESSELVYKTEGLEGFHSAEDLKQNEPMQDGPYAQLLRKLSRLQRRLPFSVEFSPVRIAIVTARNSPAEMRVIKTLRHWGVYVNEIFFLGGVEKTKVVICGESLDTGIIGSLTALGRMKSGSATKSAGRCCLISFSPHSLMVSRLRILKTAFMTVPTPNLSVNRPCQLGN